MANYRAIDVTRWLRADIEGGPERHERAYAKICRGKCAVKHAREIVP
jgi:hypothetical protein